MNDERDVRARLMMDACANNADRLPRGKGEAPYESMTLDQDMAIRQTQQARKLGQESKS